MSHQVLYAGASRRDIPLEAYCDAQHFYVAARRCLLANEVEHGVWISAGRAGAINFMLAIEIFLKSLLMRENARYGTPVDPALRWVNAGAPRWREGSLSALFPDAGYSIEDDLEIANNYFVGLRYWHGPRCMPRSAATGRLTADYHQSDMPTVAQRNAVVGPYKDSRNRDSPKRETSRLGPRGSPSFWTQQEALGQDRPATYRRGN